MTKLPTIARAKAWFFLLRPWSYTATLVPFLVAAGFGCHNPDCRWGYWGFGLLSGFLFQATVNLLNTWGDERSGVDAVPGAIRSTPQVHDGTVSMRTLLAAALTCAALAALIGVALCFYRLNDVWRLHLPLLTAGFIGFLGSTNYSTGIKFKYHGLGVPFVSFLMGPLEIFVALALLLPPAATESVPLLLLHPPVLLAAIFLSLPIAALVGVIMHGNDMRDIPTDRAAGIVTLASRLGPKRALAYYRICHILPYGVSCGWFFVFSYLRHGAWTPSWAWLPLLALPLSIRTIVTATRVYKSNPDNPPWRRLERASGAILFLYGVLYALSFALAN